MLLNAQPMFFSTTENDYSFFEIDGENTIENSKQWHTWKEMVFICVFELFAYGAVERPILTKTNCFFT